jgi:exopolysaccharide biosynthesis polyprenyl glycosylphosphotransferase
VLGQIEKFSVKLTILADSATLVISFVFAYWLRANLHVSSYVLPPFKHYAWALGFILPSFIAWLTVFGLYRSASWEQPLRLIGSIAKACLVGILTVLSLLYMSENALLSRFVIDTFALIAVAGLIFERLALRALVTQRRKRRRREVLLVAEQHDAEAYLDLLHDHPYWGVEVAAIVSPTQRVALGSVSPAGRGSERLIARSVAWRQMLDNHIIDEVVATSAWSGGDQLLDLQEACTERGLTFRILMTMPDTKVGRYNLEDVGRGRYLVSLETVPQDPLPLAVKRIIDVVGALIGLAVCGIMYLWYARRLRRESPGPVIFAQRRVGRNGRLFECYKFRTMSVGAEHQQRELVRRSKLGPVFIKLIDDPRVTSTGAWLRRYHLDEMPQFWNVLKGEMSLVGPRPSQPVEVEKYSNRQRRRLSMKPGLTGLFQINGHGSVKDFEGVVELDCAYIDNWSLWLDVRLLIKTLAKVRKADGL